MSVVPPGLDVSERANRVFERHTRFGAEPELGVIVEMFSASPADAKPDATSLRETYFAGSDAA